MRCDECRYWKRYPVVDEKDPDVDSREGSCRRSPPIANWEHVRQTMIENPAATTPMDEFSCSVNWMWPVTCGDDFCGEFLAK